MEYFDIDSEKNRKDATRQWAKEREKHFANPSPGLWGNIIRKLDNFSQNRKLEAAERNDSTWEHYPIDRSGLIYSPVDKARFDVYEKMLKAHQQGQDPDAETRKAWRMIREQGEIPFSE